MATSVIESVVHTVVGEVAKPVVLQEPLHTTVPGEVVAKPPLLQDPLHTVGGDGTNSYFKNSYYQRMAAGTVKEKIHDAIIEKLDIEGLFSMPMNTIRIADLGCAVGPNTFITIQHIIEAMEQKYQSKLCPNSQIPEFQVFFNDQVTNDFNTLFTSLPPERKYFASGVPGSFHDRLFPESSLHFALSSIALHWLSRVPKELLDENSPAWNKGRVHYTSAPDEVVRAYEAQFAKDMGDFLNARAKELLVGGLMVIIMPGIPSGMPHSEVPPGIMYDLMASSFMDMVKEGLISEAQVDSFNVPMYSTSEEELRGLIEENGCFSIEEMELTNPSSWIKGPVNMREWMKHMRAAMEEMFITHFKIDTIEDMFERLTKKLEDNAEKLESSCKLLQLFVVLKRV